MNFPERTIKSCCIVSYCIVFNRAVSSLTDTTNTLQTPPPNNVHFHHRRLAPRPQIISFSVFAQRRAQWQISGLVNEDLFCQPALSSTGGLRPGRSSVCGLWLAPRTPSNTRSHCSYQRCTKTLHFTFSLSQCKAIASAVRCTKTLHFTFGLSQRETTATA